MKVEEEEEALHKEYCYISTMGGGRWRSQDLRLCVFLKTMALDEIWFV